MMMIVPIVVTLVGIITDDRAVQWRNPYAPNDRISVSINDDSVDEVGIKMITVIIPIEMTLVGIVTDVSDVHPMKAPRSDDRVRVSIEYWRSWWCTKYQKQQLN